MKKKTDELQLIPGIGPSLAADLRLIGIDWSSSVFFFIIAADV